MKIMVLECNPEEQTQISNLLTDCEIVYKTTVAKAINHLGIEHVDFALIDADYGDHEDKLYDWKALRSFLELLNINYSVFSSNGKVGIKNGQKIFSIKDLSNVVQDENAGNQ